MPIDGLPTFLESTWKIIKSSKDVNLPDQREMAANLRCADIKDEAEESVKDKIKKFDGNNKTDFAGRCAAILDQALAYYDDNAASYRMFS